MSAAGWFCWPSLVIYCGSACAWPRTSIASANGATNMTTTNDRHTHPTMSYEVWLCYHIAPATIRTKPNRLIATATRHPRTMIS